jgi:hypothetical protein
MKTKATIEDLTEARRLIAKAVELEREAVRLRERAAILTNPAQPRVWTGEGLKPGSVRWGLTS